MVKGSDQFADLDGKKNPRHVLKEFSKHRK